MSLAAPTNPQRQVDDLWRRTPDRPRPVGTSRRRVAPSGWYPDPPALRFWDGEAWTVLTKPAGPPAEEDRVPEAPEAPAQATLAPVPSAAPEPMLVAVPDLAVPVLTSIPGDAAESTEERPRMRHELLMLLWVAFVALGAGAVVAALGIAFTV